MKKISPKIFVQDQALDGTVSGRSLGKSTAASEAAQSDYFKCHMLNKNDTLQPYILELGQGELRVLSTSENKVKATLSLELAHGRLMPKKSGVTLLETNQLAEAREECKGQTSDDCWYPLKLMVNAKKSRMLYFESRRERKDALAAILTEQGF